MKAIVKSAAMFLLLFMLTMLFMLVFSLASHAFAETGGSALPAFDLAAWGASVLIFSKALELLVQFVKVRLKKRVNVSNPVVHALNFGLGIAIGLYLSAVGLLSDPTFGAMPYPLGGILFGVIAGAVAAGWYDIDAKPDKKPPNSGARNGQL